MIAKIIERCKVEICFGLEGQELPLMSADDQAAPGASAAAGCPISGATGYSGGCPFGGAPPRLPRAAPAPNTTLQLAGDASRLPKDDAVSRRSSGLQGAAMAGRLLGNALQTRLDKLVDEDPDLCCPVSLMVFNVAVIASDGFTYEEESLTLLLLNRQVSPMTRERLRPTYRYSPAKQAEVEAFRHQRSQELLDFAAEAVIPNEGLALTALERVADYLETINTAPAVTIKAHAKELYAMLGRTPPASLQ
jgi:hypothetical protein